MFRRTDGKALSMAQLASASDLIVTDVAVDEVRKTAYFLGRVSGSLDIGGTVASPADAFIHPISISLP